MIRPRFNEIPLQLEVTKLDFWLYFVKKKTLQLCLPKSCPVFIRFFSQIFRITKNEQK